MRRLPDAGPFRAVSVGLAETCALAETGQLTCFRGDGSPTLKEKTWSAVSAGATSSCGLTADGELECWGKYSHYNNGTTSVESFDVSLGTGWVTFDSGKTSCGIKATGGIWCWSDHYSLPSPSLVADGMWTAVAAADDRIFAISDDHQLWALGEGPIDDAHDWATLDAGREHVCAIKLDGSLWCWGNGDFGRLGIDPPMSTTTPTHIAGTWTAISAGAAHTCGVQINGSMWCWGADGTRGSDSAEPVDTQVQSAALSTRGTCTSCAVSPGGELACWGCSSPEPVRSPSWSHVSTGDNATCAMRIDGSLWCSTDTAPLAPRTGTSWDEPSVVEDGGCATKTDHSLWCWGRGALGDGSVARDPVDDPVRVAGEWSTVVLGHSRSATSGDFARRSTCALSTAKELWCWGVLPLYGSAQSATAMPTQIPGTWSTITMGMDICAIAASGALWCIPSCTLDPAYNYVCDGFTTQIPGTWLAVSSRPHATSVMDNSAASRTCGVKNDHSLWCWEAAGTPQEQVPGEWIDVSVGRNAACGTHVDGSVWCWGANNLGQLGTGDAWTITPTEMVF